MNKSRPREIYKKNPLHIDLSLSLSYILTKKLDIKNSIIRLNIVFEKFRNF